LDVFEAEPLPLSSPLVEMENVLLSGHVAGLDHESHDGTFGMNAQTIIDLHAGKWPKEQIRNLEGVNDWTWER
jgi:phosphoglycerate dehydrogenase-like enzyme